MLLTGLHLYMNPLSLKVVRRIYTCVSLKHSKKPDRLVICEDRLPLLHMRVTSSAFVLSSSTIIRTFRYPIKCGCPEDFPCVQLLGSSSDVSKVDFKSLNFLDVTHFSFFRFKVQCSEEKKSSNLYSTSVAPSKMATLSRYVIELFNKF